MFVAKKSQVFGVKLIDRLIDLSCVDTPQRGAFIHLVEQQQEEELIPRRGLLQTLSFTFCCLFRLQYHQFFLGPKLLNSPHPPGDHRAFKKKIYHNNS